MQIYIFALIDYAKILIKDIDTERLEKQLEFYRGICLDTSEYKTKQIAEYHFCKITIFDSGVVLFSGSIHKFWNSINGYLAPNYNQNKANYKGYNGNLFTLKDITEIMQHLQDLFDCEPQQMIFRNIELGFNVELNFNPNIFLKGLLYHKGEIFESGYNRNFYQAWHQQYIIKVYNKGKQYQITNNVLRFEIKYLKMNEVNRLGIRTFNDVNKHTLEKATNIILKRFDEVVYYDRTISKRHLTNRQLDLIKNYSNQRYWIDELESNHRDRHKKRLQRIISTHSDNLHQQIKNEILKKCVIINR